MDSSASPGIRGKRVIVTAAAAGIGKAMAAAFLQAGAKVHICDVDEPALSRFAAEHPLIGVTRADVSKPEEVRLFFRDAAAQLGGVDILVNNAGIAGPTARVEDVPVQEWIKTVEVNLNAQFYCTRLAVPLLKQAGGGCIINLSSSAGLLGYPMRTPYAASKWAVIGFTKSLAMELGPFGIRVNAICPGSVEGERMDRVVAAEARTRGVCPEQVRQGYVRTTSLRTFIAAQEVANLVLFVCSDFGTKISGQALSIDGHTETLGAPD
jgi:NAD(P)-dependent dehydrogenase (short-subunit alcohol dehydrogenase family)